MLADEIIGLPSKPFYQSILPVLRTGYHWLGRELVQCQRFVLNREAVFLTHTISNIPPSRIIPALPLCRMPYPKMWVEFAYKDRDDWHNAANVRRNHSDTAGSPSRLGFFIEQKDADGRLIEISAAWRHRHDPTGGDETIVIGGYSTVINFNDGVQVTDELRERYARSQVNPSPIERKFDTIRDYGNPADNEAALELEARIELAHCEFMLPFWAYVQKHRPQDMARLREDAVFDVLQEWRFIIGLLTVLNSRNIIDYSPPVTFERLNKARVRKGAPPLHAYREIRLAISRVQRNRMGNGAGLLHAHLVRGHWKLRRSGLFWWSRHVRGVGEVENKPYMVRGGDLSRITIASDRL